MSFKQDFKSPRSFAVSGGRRCSKRRHLPIIVGLLIVLVVAAVFLSGESTTELEARTNPVEIAAPQPALPPQPIRRELHNRVQSGETITALLGDYFTAKEIHNLNLESRDLFPFSKICAGQPYLICTTDGEFDKFVYEIDDEEQLVIRRDVDETFMELVPIIYDVKTELVQGTIKTSLFDAVTDSGEEPELAIALADIFAWDIDFILDLRVGDTFQALVEKRFREGEPAGYGDVLAAEFINRKKTFHAILYQDGDQKPSYYDLDGDNVRKAFLKAPLSFSRISSGFTMKRFHPITKTWKSHPAIDYAAAPGTPIKTVGDGSITRIGYTKGNGNFIEVRHSNGYKTLYLHMKGFARGMSRGKRITQGQIIGYVGRTGLATGPHLCFRMKRDGKPVNPYRVKVPAAKAVAKANMADFKFTAAPLLAQFAESREIEQQAQLDLKTGLPVLESTK